MKRREYAGVSGGISHPECLWRIIWYVTIVSVKFGIIYEPFLIHTA